MSSKQCIVTMSLAAALAGCWGNYSNEDVDFLVALPYREELTAKLPGQALTLADSAEQYKLTRGVVTQFNALAYAFLGLIDAVRSFPPTDRMPNSRIWGPFPNDKHPDWQVRVRIERTDLERFDYRVQVRRTG